VPAGTVPLSGRAGGHVTAHGRTAVEAGGLAPPVTLTLPPAPDAGPASQEEERETLGGVAFGVAAGGEVKRELAGLPDTYLMLRDPATLVNLLRVRHGDAVLTEILDPADASLPAGAEPGAILRWQAGDLSLTDLDLSAFAKLKAGLPAEVV
jgi:hypothetical protein